MSNRAIWDIRQRHIWLASPSKSKAPKARTRKRCGLQSAQDRKAPKTGSAAAEQSASAE